MLKRHLNGAVDAFLVATLFEIRIWNGRDTLAALHGWLFFGMTGDCIEVNWA